MLYYSMCIHVHVPCVKHVVLPSLAFVHLLLPFKKIKPLFYGCVITPELRTPLYKGKNSTLQMVSSLDGFHSIYMYYLTCISFLLFAFVCITLCPGIVKEMDLRSQLVSDQENFGNKRKSVSVIQPSTELHRYVRTFHIKLF